MYSAFKNQFYWFLRLTVLPGTVLYVPGVQLFTVTYTKVP